jgi:ribonuclease BN (tRNA processing enzyme)
MLTFTFLGVGSAFAKRNLQSNVLVEAWRGAPASQAGPDDTLLIDFGMTGPMALHRLKDQSGFEYLNRGGVAYYPAIRRVLITHQHADHIGGLEELAVMNRYVHAAGRTEPFRPELISTSRLLDDLWNHSLRGGMEATVGRRACLEDYFGPRALEVGGDPVVMMDRYAIRLFPTDHIRIATLHDWPSYGLVIEDQTTGESVFFSGDTRFGYAGYGRLMERARVCFHEVQLIEQPEPVHTLLSELRTMPEAVRARTWLYHCSDDWDHQKYEEVGREFAGFAEAQRRYEALD